MVPNQRGWWLGRPDLVQGCALNHNPNSAIGRGNKVGKEEIVGLVKAVELFIERDEDAELAEWSRMCEVIAGELDWDYLAWRSRSRAAATGVSGLQ